MTPLRIQSLASVLALATATFTPHSAHADDAPELRPPALVQADEGGGDGFRGQASFLSGRTVGQGTDAVIAELGWPGFSFGFLHGYSPQTDLGGRITLNYGFEGTPHINPGLTLQGDLRWNIIDEGRVNFGLRFDPGLNLYFQDTTQLGFILPVAFLLGISVGDAMMISLGVDVPLAIFVAPDGILEVPVLLGAGFEYHIDSHLTLGLDVRFGPDVFVGHDTHTEFAFRTLGVLGYRF